VAGFASAAGFESATVPRATRLAGEPIGGLGRAELDRRVDAAASDVDELVATVSTPDGELVTTVGDLGWEVDRAATAEAAMGDGAGGLAARFGAWLRSWGDNRSVDLVLTEPDGDQLAAALARLDPDLEASPVEPDIVLDGGEMVVRPGVDGTRLDVTAFVDGLPTRLHDTSGDVELTADLQPIAPQFSDEELAQVAERLNLMTADGIAVAVGDAEATIGPEQLRRWIRVQVGPALVDADLDDSAAQAYLEARFADLTRVGPDATFTVEDGVVRIVPPAAGGGQRCCDETAGSTMLAALEAGEDRVELAMAPNPSPRDEAWAEELGIVEQISTFTTNHAAGQSRVVNIQNMADRVRGAVIEPGETFSLNGYVGQRTVEKGFVSGGVIYSGQFTSDIGGGVSQFATTLFNAAFFGGLEYGEYQSHSRYISRYPYGREATVSWTHPDLQIHNPTPHGVLIWPSYTPSSITVTLYSTRWATGEQTGQWTSRSGGCTFVTTERTRTFVDGTTDVDSVNATYRPGTSC
ncbi:MAG: VanW family protein, partial [Actinomycetota bacterium]|nr:VanW family protein [Actinomycetota bacterium]